MFKIDENKEYILEQLPGQDQSNWKTLCNTMWRPNEHLYLGPVPKTALPLPQEKELIKIVLRFYVKKLYNLNYNTDCDDYANTELKDFCKLCWLCNEYFSNGFYTYYGAHWNPRTQSNAIHPGGGRKFIDTFFSPENTIEMFYFNTQQVQPDFLENMRIVSPEQLEKMGYEVTLVADHGSIIPHVFYSDSNKVMVDTTSRAMEKFLDRIKIRAMRTGFFSKTKLPDYLPEGKDVYVEFKKKYTDLLMSKAVLLGVMRLNYEDKHLKVIAAGL